MPTIGEGTPVVFTMKQIVGIVGGSIGGLLLGGGVVLWTVLSFTIGGLREDVSAIRTDISALQASAIAAPTRFSEAQDKLTKEMSDLRVALEEYHGELKATNVSLDYLVQGQKIRK
jgi:hypothetical protein